MQFIKYNSLENHYRDKFIQKVFDEGYGKETFVCTEKVHGANFSFYFNGHLSQVSQSIPVIP